MTEESMTTTCTGIVTTGIVALSFIIGQCDNQNKSLEIQKTNQQAELMIKSGYVNKLIPGKTEPVWVKEDPSK